MKTVINIQGMTCNGCKAGVTEKIASLEGVKEVYVSLEEEKAIVVSTKEIDIAILRKELSSKYTISLKSIVQSNDSLELVSTLSDKTFSKWRQLKSLFLILGYISLASILLHHKEWNIREVMLDFMGLFFIVFSFFKLLDVNGFVRSFAMYDPLAARVKQYAWIYPFFEVCLGLMLLLRWEIPIALIITIIILGITTIGVTSSLLAKRHIQCACLGTALKLPMTEATFIENALMITMAGIILIIR